jgi:hypothetical protein
MVGLRAVRAPHRQDDANRQQHKQQRGDNGAGSPLMVVQVAQACHAAGEHHGKHNQDGNRADVNENLHGGEKRRAHQHKKSRHAEQTEHQIQCGVDEVACGHDTQRTTQDNHGKNEKGYGLNTQFKHMISPDSRL